MFPLKKTAPIIALSLLFTGSAFAQSQTPSGPPPGDPLGPDLYQAIGKKSSADVRSLIAKGAKLDATNWLGITPLMWAAYVGDVPVCAALIDAKADVNAASHYGTALSFAEMGGNARVVDLLLQRGAKLTEDRSDGITPLMTAAAAGHIEVMRLLLTAHGKEQIAAQDVTGATALIHAAERGQSEAVRLLLDSGAAIDRADKSGRTPLMAAARAGSAGCTNLLLQRKANANVRDASGNTALLLAARYSDDPAIAAALVRAGADATIQDGRGRTARQIADARKNPSKTAAPREASARGLALIERSTAAFSKQVSCISCHHQGLGLMASGLAKERGRKFDQAVAQAQVDLILKGDAEHINEIKGVLPHPEMYKHLPGMDMGEMTPALAFIYSGLLAHGQKPTEAQEAMTIILASQQSDDGHWGFLMQRAPIQSSQFATTALIARLIDAFLPADRAAEKTQRLEKARKWLAATTAATTEDKTYRLLGLRWTNADATTIESAAADLLRAQRADGGWAQLPTGSDAYSRSDAYATGQALYALNVGGRIAAKAAAYQRGVRYLLRTQDDDGSWFVTKRAIPANTYMDGGFPHGESQYVSYGATCWATMALMLADDDTAAPKTATAKATVR